MKPITRRIFTVSVSLALSLLVGVLLAPTQIAMAFKKDIHKDITEESLKTVSRTIDGRILTFSIQARDETKEANAGTDSWTSANAFWAEANHFDNEQFAASTARLKLLKDQIIHDITQDPPDGAAARQKLGTALHTVQDFYAHSNWVETRSGVNQSLGVLEMPNPSRDSYFCPNDKNILEGEGKTGLTTGYFELSWLDAAGVILSGGRSTLPVILDLCMPPIGKCTHGVEQIPLCAGVAKDKSGPGSAAYEAAKLATIDYVSDILDAEGVTGNARATRALMGLGGNIAFVIDDTGSMGGVLDAVKSQVAAIVSDLENPANTDNKPSEYLLVRFGDPDVGEPFKTDNASAFLAEVNGLAAAGGGDCPELSMTALMRAVASSQEDSAVYLFTDADAKDSGLSGAAISAARAKDIQVNFVLTGSCGEASAASVAAYQGQSQQGNHPDKTEADVSAVSVTSSIDPAYTQVAEQTGGQLLLINEQEVDSIFELVRSQLSGQLTPVILVSDVLAGTAKEYTIPVDSTVRDLVISVSTGGVTSEGDIDYYRFSGLAGEAITATIAAESLSSSLDSYLRLFDSDGETVLAENDDHFGLDSQIKMTLPQTGSYYVNVSDLGNGYGSEYYYTLNLAAQGAPARPAQLEVESNNVYSEATTIQYGDIVSGTINVANPTRLVLTRPNGQAAIDGQDGIRIHELDSGYIVTLAAPVVGNWKLQLSGVGAYSIAVNAKSELMLVNSEFVEYRIARHLALYPVLADQPTAGDVAWHSATLSGPYQTTAFQLVDPTGAPVAPVSLAADHPDAATGEFIGEFSVPNKPFRIAVTGVDLHGNAYQRVIPRLFQPQPLELSFESLTQTFVPGVIQTLPLRIRNFGPAASIAVTVTDNLGAIQAITPATLTLASGISSTVALQIRVPPSTPMTTPLTIAATASVINGSGRNHITWNFALADSAPPLQIASGPSMRFVFKKGGTLPPAKSLTFSLARADEPWTAATDSEWLKVEPKSGTGSSTVTVTVIPAALTTEVYTGVVQISSQDTVATRAAVLVVEAADTETIHLPLIVR